MRILDLTRVLAGPFATQQLADQGADVIKVEPPGGEETRGFGPVVNGDSTYFLAHNRNKRSIVLDLQTSAGRAVAHRLVQHCDVLVENYRPGVTERLGLGWETVHALNPRLVYVAIHAFGDSAGDDVTKRPGYDLIVQGMAGSLSFSGFPGSPPLKSALSMADIQASLLAVQGVLMGLLHRERTGEGCRIVVNMMQAQTAALTYHASRFAVTGEQEVQRGNAHGGLVPYGIYRCSDGWLTLGCGNDGLWQRLRERLGLADEPRWRTNLLRVEHRDEVDAALQAALSQLTVEQADALLSDAVPCGPVNDIAEALAHPAVTRVPIDHPAFGPVEVPGPLLQTPTTVQAHSAPPGLGEHSDAVLSELGFSSAEVDVLRRDGAFG